jgi:drug/metabolite transporter (DMT)-like permease
MATLTGFGAILLWALLALLTVQTNPVPPFQLNAMTFALGALVGLVWAARTGGLGALARVPARVYAFGALALFAYHALYFTAFRLAETTGSQAETGLIAYLWPLLIVLFSGLLPGERLRLVHVAGALIAGAGAALIVLAGAGGFQAAALPGYLLAVLCALTWAGYSVLSRRFGTVPTAAVTVYCAITALMSVPVHLMTEDTAWPIGSAGWASLLALGLGPVGLAFFLWDQGVKRGNIQLLGTASFAAPLLSTLALILAGRSEPTITLAISALLITGGAALAALGSRVSGTGG